MNYLSANDIRRKWLEFFKERGHTIIPSASLIPVNDNSLLWINSGVAALKPYFDGREVPPSVRMVNSQKSLRTNDIENVGQTARHHTLFEMLGNFSIGDYFKELAIVYAWDFLTSNLWLGLDPKKLYVTVYMEDQETYDLWKNKIGLDESHIILGTKETNFWDMGQGPCGPNTEIFYDRGEQWDPMHYGIKLLQEEQENDRYLEIWNIVFSQYNNDGTNHYQDLPRKNIDTGAGLERLACILQETPTSFETDLFMPIIKACEKLTKFKYQLPNNFDKNNEQTKINAAFKVIADHIRAITFAIGDGVFPSNKERGYVIRRLIRRSLVFAHKLNINVPFLYQLVPIVIATMEDYYPYLSDKASTITTSVKKEEANYFTKIKEGYHLFRQIVKKEQRISDENAFKLYDTFGFPIELTLELARDAEIEVDFAGYEALLAYHKETARNARRTQDISVMNLQNKLLLDLKMPSTFIGYDTLENKHAKILAMFDEDILLDNATNQVIDIIFDKTPFYAEKGGQANDTGLIQTKRMQGTVVDVKVGPNKQHIHRVQLNGYLSKKDTVHLVVNHEQRTLGMKNHSGTHLLHAAIREILGKDAMQIGSFNNSKYLRIDINYNDKITKEKSTAITKLVHQWIKQNNPVEIYHTSYEEALKMHAIAFFNEKYDAVVRIIKFGDYSIELCGGTHVQQTGDIEDFLITNIESKGVGVYRFHALTAFQTINNYFSQQTLILKEQATQLFSKYQAKENQDTLLETLFTQIKSFVVQNNDDLEKLHNLINQLQINLKKWQQATSNKSIQQELKKYEALPIKKFNNYNLLIHEFQNLSSYFLRVLADYYRKNNATLLTIFTSVNNQQAKNNVIVAIGDNLILKGLSAQRILKFLTSNTGGGGGGNMVMAIGAYINHETMINLWKNFEEEAFIWNI